MFRSYVEAVLAGREMADSSVGRALHDLVQSVPKMDTDEFEKMLNSNMRVSYFTNDDDITTYIDDDNDVSGSSDIKCTNFSPTHHSS